MTVEVHREDILPPSEILARMEALLEKYPELRMALAEKSPARETIETTAKVLGPAEPEHAG